MPSGKKRKRHKINTHKRKKRLRKNRHKRTKLFPCLRQDWHLNKYFVMWYGLSKQIIACRTRQATHESILTQIGAVCIKTRLENLFS